MKSEHRHELQTNELSKLADRLGFLFETYYNQILWVVVGLMLAGAGWTFWTRTTRNAEASAWTEISSCRTPEDFADVARKHPRTHTADWARLHEADLLLASGIHDAFSSREKANKDLDRAKSVFQELVDSSSTHEAVRERALFGLARVLESTSDGDEVPAVKVYETLLEKFPETIYKAEAQERIETLKTNSAQSFYAWFHQQNPEPPKPAKPKDGEPASTEKSDTLSIPSMLQQNHPKPGTGVSPPRLDGEPAPESKTEESKPEDATEKPSGDAKESSGTEPQQPEPKNSAAPGEDKKSDPESR